MYNVFMYIYIMYIYMYIYLCILHIYVYVLYAIRALRCIYFHVSFELMQQDGSTYFFLVP